jgi:valyl-tRNA synthetase
MSGVATVVNEELSEVNGIRPYHRDIAVKLDALAVSVEKSYADYRFNDVAQQLYDFLWGEFCDKFLEAVKGDLRDTASPEARKTTLAVFDSVMSRFLQLLHPFMPHITEELSARMGYLASGGYVMEKMYPSTTLTTSDDGETNAEAIYAAAGKMRNLKAEYNVATRKDVKFLVIKASDWLLAETDVLGLLAGGDIEVLDIYDAPKGTPAAVTDVGEIYMPLDGLIDMQAEKSRLDKEIAKVAQEVKKCEAKLGNSAFVDKAPTELVDREKSRLDEWAQKHSQLQEMRSSLG